MAPSANLTSRKKGEEIMYGREISNAATNDSKTTKNLLRNKKSNGNGKSILPAAIVISSVVLVMILASNTFDINVDLLHIQFKKSVKLVEDHKKTVTEKYKLLTNTIDEEEFIIRRREIGILKADAYTKKGSIDKLYLKLDEHKEELAEMQSLMNKIEGDISRFCGDCKIYLGGKHRLAPTCNDRLNFILKTHRDTNEYFVKYTLMDDYPECRKQLDVKLFKPEIFCYSCSYIGNNNQKAVCGSRLKFMLKKYGGDEDVMKEQLINEYPSCKRKKKVNIVQGFCSYCIITIGKGRFKKSISCGERVSYLAVRYGDDREDVKAVLIKEYPDICKKEKSVTNGTSIFCPSCEVSIGPKEYAKVTSCGKRLEYLQNTYKDHGGVPEMKEDLIGQHPECKMTFCDQCNITVIAHRNVTDAQEQHSINNAITNSNRLNRTFYESHAINTTTEEYRIDTTCIDQVDFYVSKYGKEEDFVKDRIAHKYPICKQNNFGICCDNSSM